MVCIWFWSNKEKKRTKVYQWTMCLAEFCMASFVFFFFRSIFVIFKCVGVWICEHRHPRRPEALGLPVAEVTGWVLGMGPRSPATAGCTLNSWAFLQVPRHQPRWGSEGQAQEHWGSPVDTWVPAPMKHLLSKGTLGSEGESSFQEVYLVQSIICI